MDQDALVTRFRALHVPGRPLVVPNPWDAGSARLLAHLGFAALATTSSGFAATLGRRDGGADRRAALDHAAELAAAVAPEGVPVSADLEHGYADAPEDVAATVAGAVAAGLAGCSIEDWDPVTGRIYDVVHAADRIRAATEAAGGRIVLTARAENLIRGRDDLDDTVHRLQAFAAAGADVVYAPGLTGPAVRRVVESVGRPVNVLLLPGDTVADLADAGVARVSVGGTFAFAALGALGQVATQLRDHGTLGSPDLAAAGRALAAAAFTP